MPRKGMNVHISPSASIGKDTHIDNFVSIYGRTRIGSKCFIGDYVIIGHPCEEDIEDALNNGWTDESKEDSCKEITIGDNVIIQPNVVISGGVSIGDGVKIGPFVTIGKNTNIGSETNIMYYSQIYENVQVGKNCKIAGFLCDFSKIGNDVTVMGSLVHKYVNGWDEHEDIQNKSPVIEDNVIVGYGSIVIGKVKLKKGTYVAAGAIVTKDPPGNCVVMNVDEWTPREKYKGSLKDGKFFNRGSI